jgi:hypothetical protein
VEHKDNPKEIEIIDKILENIRIIDSRARITGKCCANIPEYEMGRNLEVCLDLIAEKAEEIRKWIRD